MTYSATLSLCNPDGFLDSLPVCIRAIDLLPKHLRVELDLLLRPADDDCTRIPQDQQTPNNNTASDSQLDVSFSLKLDKNQSAVCLMHVNTTTERSPTYVPTWPSKRIMRTRLRITSSLDCRNVFRAAGPAFRRTRSAMSRVTVDLRFVGWARDCKSAAVSWLLSGVSLAARLGISWRCASPVWC